MLHAPPVKSRSLEWDLRHCFCFLSFKLIGFSSTARIENHCTSRLYLRVLSSPSVSVHHRHSMTIQDWSPLGWTGLIFLLSKGLSRVFSQHHVLKASIFWCSAFFMVHFSHLYMTTGKIIALTIQTFVGKVMSLLFNILSRFIMGFLRRSKHTFTYS